MIDFKYIILVACVVSDTDGNLACGIENTNITNVSKDNAVNIARYPWMGFLFYPVDTTRYTTFVILVTRQMVLASAIEIDKFPKQNFREHARVIIGQRCGKHNEIRVRDYTYHPDYSQNTYSALALIQLDADYVGELHPVCPPPDFLIESSVFAMSITGDCRIAEVKTYKMQYVDLEDCKIFYRRTGLDVNSFWPSHTTCARSMSQGRCLWRSGTALVLKQDGHWRLLGVGIYGPGCNDPARFLDYGMYHPWTLQSVRRVGHPAVTRLADNHIVLRRKMSSIQRFGQCDDEETDQLLYRDEITIHSKHSLVGIAVYNLSLISQYEYKCVIMKAKYVPKPEQLEYTKTLLGMKARQVVKERTSGLAKPKLHLRRWCMVSSASCHDPPIMEINFYVEILFEFETWFELECYGTQPKIIDPKAVIKYMNFAAVKPPLKQYINDIHKKIKRKPYDRRKVGYWFYKSDYSR